jgi:hypothetical protein
MDLTAVVAMVSVVALVLLAGLVGTVCGRARGRAAARRRRRGTPRTPSGHRSFASRTS